MIIDLIELREAEKDFAFEISPDEIELGEEVARLVSPARITGKVKRGSSKIHISGVLSGTIEIDCTRCCVSQTKPLELDFDLVYVSAKRYSSERGTEVSDSELVVAVYDNDEIDLIELAREQILLSLPIRYYCSPDCKGLCPECGVNRNLNECDCAGKEIDPRWSALRKLRE